jgi:hypothetical protein
MKLLVKLSEKNKNVFLSKTEDRKVKQALSGGWYKLEGRGYKEGV